MEKVFFVGMHNKEGMKPLDSKTMSGKMIDLVIEKLPVKCVKTNLCEVEYLPKDKQFIQDSLFTWLQKYEPSKGDTVVLLGRWVHDNFHPPHNDFRIIKLPHPASMMGSVNKAKYVNGAVRKIFNSNGLPAHIK